MAHQKIKPIFPTYIYINNLRSFNTYFIRHYDIVNTLCILYPQKSFYHAHEADKRMLKRLLKVARSLKRITKIKLGDCNIQNRNNLIAKTMLIAKKLSWIKSLTIADFLPSYKRPIRLILWLRCAKRLENLDYRILPKDFSFKDPISFEAGIKNLFSAMRLNKVKVLKFVEFISDPAISRSFLRFDYYPKSLQKLSIQWKGYMQKILINPPPINTELEHIPNLKVVSFNLGDQAKIMEFALNSVSTLSNLVSLDLSLPLGITTEISTNANKLQEFPNLKRLKLKLQVWRKETKVFLEFMERVALVELGLMLQLENDDPIRVVKDFIAKQEKLNSLQLKIESVTLFQEGEEHINELFDVIGRFQDFRVLKLSFKTKMRVLDSDLLSNLVAKLKNMFKASVALRAFKFECNQMKPDETFMELIDSLQFNAHSLIRIKIDTGEFSPEDQEFTTLYVFIKCLNIIQILDLPKLNIGGEQSWQYFIELICSRKYLRELTLGEVKESVSKQELINCAEQTMRRRGMNKFDFKISRELHKQFSKKAPDNQKINIDEIKRINPSLTWFPKNLPIFHGSIDDTTW